MAYTKELLATLEQEESEAMRPQIKKLQLANCKFFFDFDNTITTFDVLDGIIKRFAVDKNWVVLEDAWKAGRIGSEECLSGQLRSVKVSKKTLLDYLDTVKLDKGFFNLLSMLKKSGADVVIVSDSFSFVIKYILKKNGIKGIKVYCNSMRLQNDKLIASFPHFNKTCSRCANCKKSHLLSTNPSGKFSVYIGDGLSDICPAKHTNLTFAKSSLLKHLRENKKPCIEFKHLGNVHDYLKEVSQ